MEHQFPCGECGYVNPLIDLTYEMDKKPPEKYIDTSKQDKTPSRIYVE